MNSSSSSAAITDVNTGDSTKSVSSNAGDSCTWYEAGECSRPRTCSDCLDVLLSSDDCAVAPNGLCVSMSQYESYLADRYYYTPLQRYFPSNQYSYCSADDSVCATCSEQWNTNVGGVSSYCTGVDGCVCIATCEVSDWKQTVIDDQCTVGGSSDSDGTSIATRITVSISVGIAVAIFLALTTWAVRRYVNRWHYASSANHRQAHARPEPTGPQLTLTGWKSLRQNLIDTEHGAVKGSDPVTLQRGADSSFTPATETPVEIRVEQGEGARPAFPGEERHTQETAEHERSDL